MLNIYVGILYKYVYVLFFKVLILALLGAYRYKRRNIAVVSNAQNDTEGFVK